MVEKPSRLGVSGETSTFSGRDTAYVPPKGWLARTNIKKILRVLGVPDEVP